ncbi:MAG TPA: SLBB domain-containing protein [Rubricoccaceae bacterium]|jgi:protein involved in polysaccharide export with SLBB domain
MGVFVRGTVLSAACLIVAAGLAWPSAAQVPAAPRTVPGGALGSPPAVLPRQSEASSRLALEGALDAEAYIVGPGDVFTVVVGGSVPRQVPATVSADGRLVVPEAGTFAAAGRTLARVRADVQAALRARYQNVTTDVSLSAPREFYVHVSGRVPQPGRHLVPAVARVEDAIVEASGTEIFALAQYTQGVDRTETRWPALRNVSVVRRSGERGVVDLMRYFATGDLAANPYLQDGDAINVPTFDPLVEGVVVDGAVDRPGTYDARDGDTAADLLTVASGSDASARIARVRRVRPTATGTSDVREVSYGEAQTLDVRPRDQIYAVPANPDADRVEVVGAVRFPGLYPVTSGETSVAGLVAMAGGLREDALVRGVRLERRPRPSVTTAVVEADTAPDVSVESDLLGGLFGRQFYARQTQRAPRVALDPERAVAGTQDVRLRGGDLLTVPFDNGLVRVYGRVLRGGYVPYSPGTTAASYIEQAGGLGPAAANVYVVDAATEQLVEGAETVVQPGDAVFVNSLPSPDTAEFAQLALQERQDAREDARERRTARYQFVTVALGVIGTAVSAILAYAALTTQN